MIWPQSVLFISQAASVTHAVKAVFSSGAHEALSVNLVKNYPVNKRF